MVQSQTMLANAADWLREGNTTQSFGYSDFISKSSPPVIAINAKGADTSLVLKVAGDSSIPANCVGIELMLITLQRKTKKVEKVELHQNLCNSSAHLVESSKIQQLQYALFFVIEHSCMHPQTHFELLPSSTVFQQYCACASQVTVWSVYNIFRPYGRQHT